MFLWCGDDNDSKLGVVFVSLGVLGGGVWLGGGGLRGPTHVPVWFRPPSWRPSYFSLLAQREVTKRKAPSRPRSPGIVPGACARPLRRFADGTSVCRQRTRAHRARAPLGFSLRDLAAAERDPVGARARPSWPQKPRQSNALCFALDSGSLCGAAKGGRKRPACTARG